MQCHRQNIMNQIWLYTFAGLFFLFHGKQNRSSKFQGQIINYQFFSAPPQLKVLNLLRTYHRMDYMVKSILLKPMVVASPLNLH